tara:strand:+ start:1088 stop:1387 length:300 start_codon:yes stop_codon:yes gene_type:complete
MAYYAHFNGVKKEVFPTEDELKVREQWTIDALNDDKVMARSHRDYLLTTEVDPIVTNPLRWDALSTDKQNEWKTYRQALLDVPAQSGFPNSVTWPTKPT